MKVTARLLMCLCLVGGVLWAQHEDEIAKADQFYAEKSWENAAAAYGSLALKMPDNGRIWMRLGMARYNTGSWRDAAQALEKAESLGFAPVRVQYQLARAHANLKQTDKALNWLEKTLKGGFNRPSTLESEPAFDDIRDNPRFKAVLTQAKRNKAPCEVDPKHREFDFWLGTWDVYTKAGQKAGVNTITKEENGCMLLEKWVGASGGTGTSMNYYDSRTQEWVQMWMGFGVHAHMRGGLKDGSMVLTGHITYYNNNTHFPFRGTWTQLEDGRVRQFFEQSNDDGKTWSPWFEGFYQRQDK